MREPERMGIYIHVPFCVRKCNYCDFLSFPTGKETSEGISDRERYVKALCREIRSRKLPLSEEKFCGEQDQKQRWNEKLPCVASIFFGGGTPSLLTGEQIGRILDSVRMVYRVAEDAEITMEANPGTVDGRSLAAYRAAGVNRLSFGLQSAHNQELKMLGRIHTWEEFCENYRLAREVGYTDINIDLMSAIPGQTLASWEDTLTEVLALEPEHISAYSLIVEEGTPFYEWYGPGGRQAVLPDEDTERRMYEVTEEYLNRAGLHRYEISNYAREGCECRHNSFYWKRVPYLGFGLGASSFYGETRWRNQPELAEYLRIWGEEPSDAIQNAWLDVEKLLPEDQMAETMFLGLRMMEGIREEDFKKQFGKTLDEVYGGVLARQERLGLLERKNGRVRLTSYGIDVSNQVFCDYL